MFCILHLDVSLLGAVSCTAWWKNSSLWLPVKWPPPPSLSFIVHHHSAFKPIMVTTWSTFLSFAHTFIQHIYWVPTLVRYYKRCCSGPTKNKDPSLTLRKSERKKLQVRQWMLSKVLWEHIGERATSSASGTVEGFSGREVIWNGSQKE